MSRAAAKGRQGIDGQNSSIAEASDMLRKLVPGYFGIAICRLANPVSRVAVAVIFADELRASL